MLRDGLLYIFSSMLLLMSHLLTLLGGSKVERRII